SELCAGGERNVQAGTRPARAGTGDIDAQRARARSTGRFGRLASELLEVLTLSGAERRKLHPRSLQQEVAPFPPLGEVRGHGARFPPDHEPDPVLGPEGRADRDHARDDEKDEPHKKKAAEERVVELLHRLCFSSQSLGLLELTRERRGPCRPLQSGPELSDLAPLFHPSYSLRLGLKLSELSGLAMSLA